MTSISDLGLQQLLLSGFQRAQDLSDATQAQVSSGDRFPNYGGLGSDAVALIKAEGVVARASAFEQSANIASARFDRQATSLTQIADQLTELRGAVTLALSTQEPQFLGNSVQLSLDRIGSALNSESVGQFIFGGTQNAVTPVSIPTFDALAQNGVSAVQFNEGTSLILALDEETRVSGGPTASSIATPIFEVFSDLVRVIEADTSITGALTDETRAGLQTALVDIDRVFAGINTALAETAIRQNQANDAVAQNVRNRDLADLVAADIEDVDIAEALSRLNQDQIAVQASAQALAIATQTSLLNFI